MKTTKLTLTLSLLALAPYATAMMGDMQQPIPTTAMQNEAKSLYHQIEEFHGGSVQLPDDFAELLKNSFTFTHEMNIQEMEKMQQLHMAYCALDFPPFGSYMVKQVMGNNADFMKAFATYERTWDEYQRAWGTLRMDVQSTDTKANPSADLKKIVDLERSVQTQLTMLQKMFMADKANAALMMHMKKMEYLAEQHARWGIAFAMAVNPDMVKDTFPEAFQQTKDAVKTIFTAPKVNAFKKRLEAAKRK